MNDPKYQQINVGTPNHKQALRRFANRARAFFLMFCVSGCSTSQHPPINCALPHVDKRMTECNIVKLASDFGQCLSADEISDHSCIIMDQDLTFCSGDESINFSAIFKDSHKALNCLGGVIDHGWSEKSHRSINPTRRDRQMPFVRFFDDRSLSDVSIKNCTMRGNSHAGIQLTRFFGGQLGGDGKITGDESLPSGHSDILIEDVNIEGSQIGIYLGNFSKNVRINRVHIDGTERIAIYSEAGSNEIKITNSTISNNQSREAIAIDSTYNSEVSNTNFVNNREGGINLYRNCGELRGTVCPVIRSTPPNNNKIINNRFSNNGISAIRIASRQGRNHTTGWCASLYGLPGKFTDTAEHNVVSGNTIECTSGTAIAVMDGPNEISNNTINANEQCIPLEISTGGYGRFKKRLLNGLVVRGNAIRSNIKPKVQHVTDQVVYEPIEPGE